MKRQSEYISANQKRSPVLTEVIYPTFLIKVNKLLQNGKLRNAADILTKEILIHPENKKSIKSYGWS